MDSKRDELLQLANGSVLVYNIASRQSFDLLLIEVADCLRYKDKKTLPFIVVEINEDIEAERQVSTREGRSLAQHFDWQFVQVSRKDNVVDVDICFAAMLRQIAKWNDEEEARKRRENKKKRFWSRK